MKKILFLLAGIFMLSACSEDALVPSMEVDTSFDITDDPNDPVQHERYLIFKDYNVSVFFNDTIAKIQVGTDYYGEPVYRYETVDLNWTFDDYDRDIKYKFDYMTDPAGQAQALQVVRAYLEKCSPAMRPFSILLTNGCRAVSDSETLTADMVIGFRTLVLTNLDLFTTEAAIAAKAQAIITSQVSNKVTANKQLCERFYEISQKLGAYYEFFPNLDFPMLSAYNQSTTYGWNVLRLFHGAPYTTLSNELDFVEHMTTHPAVIGMGKQLTVEEAEAIRKQMVKELGNYGFIATDRNMYTPTSPEADLDLYLRGMLGLGAEAFEARYCDSPLVAEKYNMLYDYIVNTLKVELNKTEE